MVRILTGVQSTGTPHLGNLLGAVFPAIELSKDEKNECFFFIADLHSLTQIKNSDGVVMGNKTRVKIVKNKVAPPFKLAEFDIMYGEGISKVGEIIDLAVESEIINKSGSWFSYEGTKLGQGRDAVKTLLKDNPDLMETLETKLKEII